RRPDVFARQLHQAALSQTVTITGSATAARLIAELAVQLAAVLTRRDDLEKEIEEGFFALPEAAILRSLPDIGPRLGARIAVEIGSISRFRTPGHLAAYAGLGPTPWKSGTSINANMPSRFGNHRLPERVLSGCLPQPAASAIAYLLRPQARTAQAPQP